MVRKRSGPTMSTVFPIARISAVMVRSVRTTPFTWGSQASEMIMILFRPG